MTLDNVVHSINLNPPFSLDSNGNLGILKGRHLSLKHMIHNQSIFVW